MVPVWSRGDECAANPHGYTKLVLVGVVLHRGSVYPAENAVSERELVDLAVLDAWDGIGLQGVPPQGAERAAVRDDQDPFPGVRVRDPLDSAPYPCEVVLTGLAVVLGRPGEALLDLRVGQPRPGADVDLPQAWVCGYRYIAGGDDDLGRLRGTLQVARVDGVELDVCQSAGKLVSLRTPGLVERRIGVPLVATVAVPVGLSVADEEELGHGRLG